MCKFWNRFRILSPNSSIIRGSFSINDKRFKFGSRGLQAVPCSIIAIVFGNLLYPEEWNENFVNLVLAYGDEIFRDSRRKNRIPTNIYMSASLVYPEFFIGDYKCSICVTESIVHGNLFTEKSICLNLINGIENFFRISEAGILTTQGNSVAIWRHANGNFFYFDPTPCAKDGTKCRGGVACLMRFKYLNDLIDLILKNLNRKCDSKYHIDRIIILRMVSIRGRNDRLFEDQAAIENRMRTDCSNLKSGGKSVSESSQIRRISVPVTSYNNLIDQQVTVERTDKSNHFDTNYTYSDVRVNVPSTFKRLSNSVSILHGWTHENSEIYKGKGAQNVANCLISIGTKKFYPTRTWLRTTLDEILTAGDALHAQLRIDKPTIRESTAIDFDGMEFKIGDQKLRIKIDILTIIGMLMSRTTSVLDLRSASEEFFLINQTGIIETTMMAAAIWMEDGYYYMFDPRQCDPTGFHVVEEEKQRKSGKKDKVSGYEKKINGKCCVLQFSDINSLAAHFIQNIPLGKKNDRFLIRNIDVVEDEPGTQPWNNFEPGETSQTWLLRGTITSNSGEFNDKNRTIAISLVSLVYAKNTPTHEWTKEIVDDVILEGDQYYTWCIPTDLRDEQFDFLNFKNVLYVGNRKATIKLQEAILVGDIGGNSENEYLKLEEGINRFFKNYQYGIVEVNSMAFAIWKNYDFEDAMKEMYHLFVSNPKKSNKVNQKATVSCVLRLVNLADMAKIIMMNIQYDTENESRFLIHNVDILQIGSLMTDEEIENEKKIILKPDLHHYLSINEGIACLNGSINQGNESLFGHLTRHKQQAGNAILTLAMTKLHNPHLWSTQVLDDILKMGDKITFENLNNLRASEEGKTRDWLLPNDIAKEFKLGVNHFRFEIEENFATGKLKDLSRILEDFFSKKSTGIFEQENLIMPIWKQGTVFFTMDPIGRDNQGTPRRKDGTAAVLWFTSISTLASDLSDVAGGDANVDFSIHSITIENNFETRLKNRKVSKKGSSIDGKWYSFSKQSDGIWYIDGDIGFTNERFDLQNRGKQSAAIAVMAIVFSKIYDSWRWTAEILDEVIVTGDKLHSNCVDGFENNVIPRVNQIMNEFFLSDRRINISMNDCVESGGVNNQTRKIQDAFSGVSKFFHQYHSGILIANFDKNLAIWRIGDFYYCLLPTSRLMRFAETADLVDQLMKEFSIVDYEIVAVDVINWNKMPPWQFDPSTIILPLSLPPQNAYERLQGAARAFLRSTSDQVPITPSEMIRNQQAAANCIVALGTSFVKNPNTWTTRTLDEISSIGHHIYRESLRAWPGKVRLRPEEIINVFHLGQNVLTMDVSLFSIDGIVSMPPPEPETKGKKIILKKKPQKKKKKGKLKREPPIPKPPLLLEEGIKRFLERNEAGVLIIGHSVISIWKQLGVYFIYSPYAWNNHGVKNESDSSCVVWFACMEPYYNFIHVNLNDEEKYATYEIRKVVSKTTSIKPLPCTINMNVCKLSSAPTVSTSKKSEMKLSGIKTLDTYNQNDGKMSILHGTRNMDDVTIDERNRSFQSTAASAIAIVVGSIHVPSTWTSNMIDAILTYGNLLHLRSCRLFGLLPRNLSPRELQTVFIIGDFRAHIHVDHNTMTGLLFPYDVTEKLHHFFRSSTCGILYTNDVAMAVSQHFGKFYLFNPCHKSRKFNSDVPSFVIKSPDLTVLAHAFVDYCNFSVPRMYALNAVDVLSLSSFSNAEKSYILECQS